MLCIIILCLYVCVFVLGKHPRAGIALWCHPFHLLDKLDDNSNNSLAAQTAFFHYKEKKAVWAARLGYVFAAELSLADSIEIHSQILIALRTIKSGYIKPNGF